MRRWDTPFSRPRASAVAAALAAALLVALPGCVTRGTHEEVVEERDALRQARSRLEERVKLLEASNEALGAERVELIDETEDLRQARDELSGNVRRLQRRQDELAASLAQREERLEELERLTGTYEALVADLESEVAAGEIQIEQLREGIRLNLPDHVLFPSGSARLGPQGQRVVRSVAEQLRELPHSVEVQGHTDDVPVRGSSTFPSNWELAARRATEVVRLLQGAGVAPERLRAVSYGPYQPVAPNDGPENRARNRRIEIRLEPAPARSGSPPPSEPPSAGGS